MECQVATKIHGENRKSNTELRQGRHFINCRLFTEFNLILSYHIDSIDTATCSQDLQIYKRIHLSISALCRITIPTQFTKIRVNKYVNQVICKTLKIHI